MHQLEQLNRLWFLHLNGAADTPAGVVAVATAIGEDVIYLIPLLLLGQWLWGTRENRALALQAFLVTFLALGLNQLIGLLWTHPRPLALGLGHTWLLHPADSSFPSDHMTVFASIGLTLLFGSSVRLGAAVLGAGVAVAWARVFLGLHFPLDMAGGVAVAGVAYALVAPLWRTAGETLVNRAEQLYRTVLARPIAAGWTRR